MSMCPVCNGLNELNETCKHCHTILVDHGRMMDFGEKYDAYLPIEMKKLDNGIKDDQKEEKCAHIVACPTCNKASLVLIQEW
ncbi:hypothetical protein [Halalkalibacter sp. APA_J-10(15)]|uniref:hypothetical protein n=1 Tax=unclassified Halalkalibacter TaxID=2893063 RepID=UPI001FF32B86|nr:hypothetical protein [Halalkalibacter sp. APA_J-10(15)]MCK0470320.1 hypothetical protein [Halalkalibacter sp. APA_J-10(15)]